MWWVSLASSAAAEEGLTVHAGVGHVDHDKLDLVLQGWKKTEEAGSGRPGRRGFEEEGQILGTEFLSVFAIAVGQCFVRSNTRAPDASLVFGPFVLESSLCCPPDLHC